MIQYCMGFLKALQRIRLKNKNDWYMNLCHFYRITKCWMFECRNINVDQCPTMNRNTGLYRCCWCTCCCSCLEMETCFLLILNWLCVRFCLSHKRTEKILRQTNITFLDKTQFRNKSIFESFLTKCDQIRVR